MNNQRAKYPFAILTGLTLVGALAGCSSAAEGDTTTTDTGTTDSSESTTDSTDAATTGSYADGTYTEDADYQSPNGTENVEVTVTLADGVITAVEVVGDGDNPNSKRYQTAFADGIADVVEGVNIDEISVDKVAGSSLTSDGFNAAIEEIKADAAS
ncbi:uncharacterized protein with FMN-binding domain [Conyzicola lurida]|uniref:Uncharacterized protein with FMN-binding domain n=1 Tax=Conyzicola lurida TaxID=1172621 RepID=A0A841AHN6_9MICO|nr:FMN-binding protein [Conyzicola lurida]MBB5841924.1 uncharacterized protein with FMN-binding domain [Conyzicola lurida]